MQVLTRCAVVVAAAAMSLAFAAAPASSAAIGELILKGEGPDTVITNPGPGCASTISGFSQVTNRTNVSVTVYTDIGCTGHGMVISPGTTASVGDRHSVRVPR